MKKLLFVIVCLLSFQAQAQNKQEQIQYIRKMYAEAKEQIAQNGKNGQAPLDVKIMINDGTQVDEDFIINENTELTFYFNKYRVDSDLDYPDASSCYFITENFEVHGHLLYREILFDPNDSYLLFSYVRQETDAGFVSESRYYYDSEGKLIDLKRKVGGTDVEPDEDNEKAGVEAKEEAQFYMDVFELLMNSEGETSEPSRVKKPTTPKADRLASIRNTYTQAKQKIADNDKSELPRDMEIVIRDQSWGPPETTEMNFYFDESAASEDSNGYYCYFINYHRHHNDMGPEYYFEYLFAPQSHDLIFSYTNAREEGEKYEWRYYYDENGKCIEVKTEEEDEDGGAADKAKVQQHLKIFNRLVNSSH